MEVWALHGRMAQKRREKVYADFVFLDTEERRRFAVEIQSVRNAAEQESKVFTESFRREALAREEDLSVLKEQYAPAWNKWERQPNGRWRVKRAILDLRLEAPPDASRSGVEGKPMPAHARLLQQLRGSR